MSTNETADSSEFETQVIVVSNREPYIHNFESTEPKATQPVGGLTAALDGVMRDIGGTWVAWGSGDADFRVVDSAGYTRVPPGENDYWLKRLPLSLEERSKYYYGYANQVLWPACHQMLSRLSCEAGYWDTYREVNERFGEAVVDALTQDTHQTNHHDSVVWFQDYHLALAPGVVREKVGEETILQHFWHIPWPPEHVFERIQHTDQIVRGLLANDRIGFHTDEYLENFLATVRNTNLRTEIDSSTGEIRFEGRTINTYTQPVGVDVERIESAIEANQAEQFWADFRRQNGIRSEEAVVVSVERLDYTKGILRRLAAVEHLLDTQESLHGSVRFVQKGTVSRAEIPAYQRYQQRVRSAVSRINDRFGTEAWQPILHIEERYPRQAVLSLLLNADVCAVSSLSDGQNLVAQEYVAANPTGTNALVLSRFTGVHTLLGGAAYSVNPHDTVEFADQLYAALSAPDSDREERWKRLERPVRQNDIRRWIEVGLRPYTGDRGGDGEPLTLGRIGGL